MANFFPFYLIFSDLHHQNFNRIKLSQIDWDAVHVCVEANLHHQAGEVQVRWVRNVKLCVVGIFSSILQSNLHQHSSPAGFQDTLSVPPRPLQATQWACSTLSPSTELSGNKNRDTYSTRLPGRAVHSAMYVLVCERSHKNITSGLVCVLQFYLWVWFHNNTPTVQ